MKNLIVYSIILLSIFTSCTGTKMATYNDDVYANPTEERQEQARIAAANKKAQDAAQKRANDSLVAQQTRDNNNPYYKDPQYNSDDYYDYAYASRVKRFQAPVSGVGYYDNYYTNTYFYSGNPYQYGMSVYNGYNFWPSYNSYNYMPSSYFYSNYGWGNAGYGMNFGSGYGYNSGFGNSGFGYGGGFGYGQGYPYYGSGFGYGAGYGYGYGNPYGYGGFGNPYGYGSYGSPYSGWGYYNGLDQNSGYTYAPRTSHDGGNGTRPTNPNVSASDPYYQSFVQKVVATQAATPKFIDPPVVARAVPRNTAVQQGNASMNPVYNNPGNNNYNNGNNNTNYTPPTRNYVEQQQHTNYNFPANNSPSLSQPGNGYVKQQEPTIFESPKTNPGRQQYNQVQQQQIQQQPFQQPTRNYEPAQNYSAPSNSFPRGGGGGGSQGGGGGGRPR